MDTCHCPVKVYLDTNIILRVRDARIKEEDADALRILSENPRILYTSKKTKREIERFEDLKGKAQLLIIYNLIQKIPEQNIIESIPALYNAVMYNEATYGGFARREDPLFTGLKKIFDGDDAEHIFQAEKHKLDYFLTLDKKTILNRVREKQNQLKALGLKIHFVCPKELIDELKFKRKTTCTQNEKITKGNNE